MNCSSHLTVPGGWHPPNIPSHCLCIRAISVWRRVARIYRKGRKGWRESEARPESIRSEGQAVMKKVNITNYWQVSHFKAKFYYSPKLTHVKRPGNKFPSIAVTLKVRKQVTAMKNFGGMMNSGSTILMSTGKVNEISVHINVKSYILQRIPEWIVGKMLNVTKKTKNTLKHWGKHFWNIFQYGGLLRAFGLLLEAFFSSSWRWIRCSL